MKDLALGGHLTSVFPINHETSGQSYKALYDRNLQL